MIYGIDCVAQNAGAAVGGYYDFATRQGHALAETWDGSLWHAESTAIPGKTPVLTGATCLAAQSCLAAGYYGNLTGGTAGYVSHRIGSYWNSQAVPNPNVPNRIAPRHVRAGKGVQTRWRRSACLHTIALDARESY